MDSDAGCFSFPPHAEPGRYVIQWWWRGYYDCFDAALLTAPAKDLYGGAVSTQQAWEKLDHSQFLWHGPKAALIKSSNVGAGDNRGINPTFDGSLPCWIQQNADGDGVSDMKEILAACAEHKECEAVQCVPLHPPAHVVDKALNAPYVWGQLVPHCQHKYFGPTQKAETSTALLCYGFKKPTVRPEVGEQWATSDDPRDAVFYSTAWHSVGIASFTGNDMGSVGIDFMEGPKTKGPVKTGAWAFGDLCISCADAAKFNNLPMHEAPHWQTSTECHACSEEHEL